MIVIAIIGILAAIALPAYAKYMARARFTEVVQATDGVKKQVELCIFAEGAGAWAAGGKINATACANGASGSGYRIGAATDYATKYVHDITVSNSGIITATAQATNGLDSHTYILEPYFGAADNGVIDWRFARGPNVTPATVNTSSCIAADLC